MVKDMPYSTIALVLESWEIARTAPNFEEKVGVLALFKLFELQPRTKAVFKFDRDFDPTPQELKDSGNLHHAIRMIHMFDAALDMLGPDTETLEEILKELGKRHIKYGVSPHFFPFMGQAIIFALQETLGKQWNRDLEEAWVEVYDELSGEIMKSIFNN